MSHLPISVVIPLYNHSRYIESTLQSVLNQSVSVGEIIVIDDGSTDDSAIKVSRIQNKHPEIIFWSQTNQGAHHAINSGIHRATQEYVAILNSDDIFHTLRLQTCITVLESQPQISAVVTGIEFINENGEKIKNPWYEQAKKFYLENGDMGLALMNGNFIMTTSNLVIRRSLFSEKGYFLPLRYAHDLEFFLRLVSHKRKILFLEENLLNYRFHKKNTIFEDHRQVRIEWAFCCALFIYHMQYSSLLKNDQWDYVEKIIQVTDKHNLTRMVLIFLLYFQKKSSTGKSPETFLTDKRFLDFMHRISA